MLFSGVLFRLAAVCGVFVANRSSGSLGFTWVGQISAWANPCEPNLLFLVVYEAYSAADSEGHEK